MSVALPKAESTPKNRHQVLNFAQNLIYKLAFGHLGKFIVIAVYYLLLQTMRGQRTSIFSWPVTLPDVKGTWDHLLTASVTNGGLVRLMPETAWTPMRHIVFRGLLEGVLGIVLFQQIGFNVIKYREKLKREALGRKLGREELGRFDRFILCSKLIASPYQDGPVTGLQYAVFPFWLTLVALVVGIPLYLGLHYGLAQSAHWSWLEPQLSSHASWAQKVYTGEYDGLIIGLVVGVIVGRTYRAYLYDNTMYFARRWVARGRREHWWMPKPTRDLIAGLRTDPQARRLAREKLSERSSASRFLVVFLPVVGLALAGFGFYVITEIA